MQCIECAHAFGELTALPAAVSLPAGEPEPETDGHVLPASVWLFSEDRGGRYAYGFTTQRQHADHVRNEGRCVVTEYRAATPTGGHAGDGTREADPKDRAELIQAVSWATGYGKITVDTILHELERLGHHFAAVSLPAGEPESEQAAFERLLRDPAVSAAARPFHDLDTITVRQLRALIVAANRAATPTGGRAGDWRKDPGVSEALWAMGCIDPAIMDQMSPANWGRITSSMVRNLCDAVAAATGGHSGPAHFGHVTEVFRSTRGYLAEDEWLSHEDGWTLAPTPVWESLKQRATGGRSEAPEPKHPDTVRLDWLQRSQWGVEGDCWNEGDRKPQVGFRFLSISDKSPIYETVREAIDAGMQLTGDVPPVPLQDAGTPEEDDDEDDAWNRLFDHPDFVKCLERAREYVKANHPIDVIGVAEEVISRHFLSHYDAGAAGDIRELAALLTASRQDAETEEEKPSVAQLVQLIDWLRRCPEHNEDHEALTDYSERLVPKSPHWGWDEDDHKDLYEAIAAPPLPRSHPDTGMPEVGT